MEELRTYLNSLTPEKQKEYADACETTVGYLRKAISMGTPIHPIKCVSLEIHSGKKVTRQSLREDWKAIWPELEERVEA